MAARTQTAITMRPATTSDYETVAALTNAVYTDDATTADTIRYGDDLL